MIALFTVLSSLILLVLVVLKLFIPLAVILLSFSEGKEMEVCDPRHISKYVSIFFLRIINCFDNLSFSNFQIYFCEFIYYIILWFLVNLFGWWLYLK